MVNQFEGLNDAMLSADKCTLENQRTIEGELSEYASLVYNTTTDEYSIESEELAELEEYDDFAVVINPDTFEGLEVGRCKVTKEDFREFRDFIESLKNKGEF